MGANHLVRKASWEFFSAADMESGGFPDATSVHDKEHSFSTLLSNAKCVNISCLISLSAEALLKLDNSTWAPVVDGVDLVDAGTKLAKQGRLAPVPVIVGSVMEDGGETLSCDPWACAESNFVMEAKLQWDLSEYEAVNLAHLYADEQSRPGGNFSKWYWAYKHASVDQHATCRSRQSARWVTAAGQSAYWYYWTYPPMGYNGRYPKLAHHACEQPFVFHVLSETPAELADDKGAYFIQPREWAFSAAVVHYWSSFAATGRPDGNVPWPRYDEKTRRALVMGDLDGNHGQMTFEIAS